MPDATERFAEMVRRPTGEIPLDEAALLDRRCTRIPTSTSTRGSRNSTSLARGLRATTAAEVAGAALCRPRASPGTPSTTATRRNSYLDDVLDRRLGIPITLSVLMIEVGASAAASPLHGVGMPGHFLVGTGDEWFDPFHGGARLDLARLRGAVRADQRPEVVRRRVPGTGGTARDPRSDARATSSTRCSQRDPAVGGVGRRGSGCASPGSR